MTQKRERRQNKYAGWKIFQDKKPPFRWRCYHRETGEKIDCELFKPNSLEFDMEIHRLNQIQKEQEAKPGTLGMLIKKYRASPRFQNELADRTRADYQKVFNYLKAIEDTPLTRFNPPLVAKIRDKALAKHKFRFANYVRTVIAVIFDWGLEYGYTKENPTKGVKVAQRPKNLPDANRPWTDAERETVLAALPSHMTLPMVLMMHYALDPQDALGLAMLEPLLKHAPPRLK